MTAVSPAPLCPISLVVLISGRGSNLQAIIDAIQSGELPARISAVISNCAGAYGLERAHRAGIPTEVLDHRSFRSRRDFDQALAALIDRYSPDLIVLAGFMRILTPEFVQRYLGRMLNIHPSLLPAFPGLHTHERALEAAVTEHGASVHFVTEQIDGGPVIIQAIVPVLPGDDAETLAERVLALEHRIYPLAIRWLAEGRLRLAGDTVWLDGRPLSEPKRLPYES